MEINVELSKALIDVKRKELENEKANLIESNKNLKVRLQYPPKIFNYISNTKGTSLVLVDISRKIFYLKNCC